MQRGGLIEHWRREFWPNADRCSTTATGGNVGDVIQAISVSDMQGSFYVLLIGNIRWDSTFKIRCCNFFLNVTNAGLGLACVIFFFERLHHHKKAQQESELIRPYLNWSFNVIYSISHVLKHLNYRHFSANVARSI